MRNWPYGTVFFFLVVLDAQVKKYKEVFIEACKQVSTPVINKLYLKPKVTLHFELLNISLLFLI